MSPNTAPHLVVGGRADREIQQNPLCPIRYVESPKQSLTLSLGPTHGGILRNGSDAELRRQFTTER
jgi:hypothetical protein